MYQIYHVKTQTRAPRYYHCLTNRQLIVLRCQNSESFCKDMRINGMYFELYLCYFTVGAVSCPCSLIIASLLRFLKVNYHYIDKKKRQCIITFCFACSLLPVSSYIPYVVELKYLHSEPRQFLNHMALGMVALKNHLLESHPQLLHAVKTLYPGNIQAIQLPPRHFHLCFLDKPQHDPRSHIWKYMSNRHWKGK